MMTMYKRYYRSEGMTLVIAADLCDASAPIRMAWVEPGRNVAIGAMAHTPYQTATARHRLSEAFRLCRKWNG